MGSERKDGGATEVRGEAGAGATERLARGRKKIERKNSLSFILFRCRHSGPIRWPGRFAK
jgi:hypothetical protein